MGLFPNNYATKIQGVFISVKSYVTLLPYRLYEIMPLQLNKIRVKIFLYALNSMFIGYWEN
jgi:hypothetical protein